MSISYNHVVLIGRLTRDPEIKFAASGTQIATFSLAVDRNIPSSNNDNTDFIRIVTFGKTAEFVGNYLSKGRLILVDGSLRINKWKTQEGESRSNAEVVASNIRFMETKAQAQNTGGFERTSVEEDVIGNAGNDEITFFGSESETTGDDIPF
jgi:single-strand DNA-binding protein